MQTRYYDPTICRFISADDPEILGDLASVVGQLNLYAYCLNNPVMYTDPSGCITLDTIFDIISLGFSIADVIANPLDLWAWAGLAGDLIDLIPIVTGVGEGVRAAKVAAKTVEATQETIAASLKSRKVLQQIGNVTVVAADAGDFTADAWKLTKSVDRITDPMGTGRKIHKGFLNIDGHTTSKGILGAGKTTGKYGFADSLLSDVNIIVELKTNTALSIRAGVRQLNRYNKALGGGYRLFLVVY